MRPKETQFSEKTNAPQQRKWIHYERPEISHQLIDRAMKQSTIVSLISQISFHISICLACNAEKALQLKITKKE